MCSGVVIGRGTVATAASCFNDKPDNIYVLVFRERIEMYLDEVFLKQKVDFANMSISVANLLWRKHGVTTREVNKVRRHPYFKIVKSTESLGKENAVYENDVAFMHFYSKLEDDYVVPVCTPETNELLSPYEKVVLSTGSGKGTAKNIYRTILSDDAPISQQDCYHEHGESQNTVLHWLKGVE